MKYLLFTVAGLIALVGIVALIGLMMNPNHRAEREARLQAPIDSVFAVISDFTNAASWRNDLIRVEALPSRNGHPVWREYDKQHSNWSYEAVEIIPNRRFKTVIADPNPPVEGGWTIDLTPDGTGTKIRIVEEGIVHNVIFRFVGKLFMNQAATIESYLQALAVRFGEEISFPK